MAHLWIHDGAAGWMVMQLDGAAFDLSLAAPSRVCPGDAELVLPVQILRTAADAGEAWLLIASPETSVRVNGSDVATGACVLRDRDEIVVAERPPMYFSAEDLARIEPFSSHGSRVSCPRCKQAIESETPAVRCPQCAVWHHQTEDLPCWLYAETCALCPQPTALETGYCWTPEEL